MQITNALLHQRNTEALGDIHRYMVLLMSETLKLSEDKMICPVVSEKRSNPYILHVSNVLFYYDLQPRTLPQNESDKILLRLTPDSYQEYQAILIKLDIHSIRDITKVSHAQHARQLRTREQPNRLLTFNELYQSLPKKIQNSSIFSTYRLELTTPRFYQALIALFSTHEETSNQHHMLDINHRFSIRRASPDWNIMATKQDVIITPGNALCIYTDRSFKDREVGAAAVIYSVDDSTYHETEIAVRMSKPTNTLATP